MRRCVLLLLFCLLIGSNHIIANNETITNVGSTAWSKPDVSIMIGESVTWNWTGGHTATSSAGATCTTGGSNPWNFTTSGQTKTFNTTGDYNYKCSIHCPNMMGIVRVQDFTVSCNSNTVNAAPGGSGNSTCTVGSVNGFTNAVTLAANGLPAGVTPVFASNPVPPPSNGTIDSLLTLNVGVGVVSGSYPFTVTGTFNNATGDHVQTFNMTLNVFSGPDFIINCAPSGLSTIPGGSDTSVCTISSFGGFSNTVDLDCTGLPAGATCGFSVNPATPPSDSSTTSDLTVNVGPAVAPGNYPFQVTGSGTPGTRSFNATLNVQDFSISSSPASVIAPPGGSAGSTTTVTSLSGFNAAVDLGCAGLPAGAICDFVPPAVTPDPGSSITSALTVNVGGAVAESSYPFQITGTFGTLIRQFDMSLDVTTAQEFGVSCTPSSLQGTRGNSAQSTCTLTSINSFNNPVTLSCTGLPTGAICDFFPNPATPPQNGTGNSVLTLTIGGSVPIGSYPFQIDTTDGTLSHGVNATLDVVPLYSDNFNDNDVSDWTFGKGSWGAQFGTLVGTYSKKTTALAPYTMSPNSTVEADVMTAGGDGNQISLYGWFSDKKNYVELLIKQESGRWILKQKINGDVVAKAKSIQAVQPNIVYHATLTYDGSSLHLSMDGTEILTLIATPPAPGSPGFKVKATTGTFDNIIAYQ